MIFFVLCHCKLKIFGFSLLDKTTREDVSWDCEGHSLLFSEVLQEKQLNNLESNLQIND